MELKRGSISAADAQCCIYCIVLYCLIYEVEEEGEEETVIYMQQRENYPGEHVCTPRG